MPVVQVIIPWRDRGIDPRRSANLDVVLGWWWAHRANPYIASDGGNGADQFNRHRAYNAAVERFPETDVFIFSEADMLVPIPQIEKAVQQALAGPGLVVPFTQYRYLSDETTGRLRDYYHDSKQSDLAAWWGLSSYNESSMFGMDAESTMDNGRSIGAINVVSRETWKIMALNISTLSGKNCNINIMIKKRIEIVRNYAVLMHGKKTRRTKTPNLVTLRDFLEIRNDLLLRLNVVLEFTNALLRAIISFGGRRGLGMLRGGGRLGLLGRFGVLVLV